LKNLKFLKFESKTRMTKKIFKILKNFDHDKQIFWKNVGPKGKIARKHKNFLKNERESSSNLKKFQKISKNFQNFWKNFQKILKNLKNF